MKFDAKTISELRAAAEAATPGPWVKYVGGEIYGTYYPTSDPGDCESHMVCRDADAEPYDDAEHINTFDPPTVLAMLAEIERLNVLDKGARAAHAGLVAEIERLRVIDKIMHAHCNLCDRLTPTNSPDCEKCGGLAWED